MFYFQIKSDYHYGIAKSTSARSFGRLKHANMYGALMRSHFDNNDKLILFSIAIRSLRTRFIVEVGWSTGLRYFARHTPCTRAQPDHNGVAISNRSFKERDKMAISMKIMEPKSSLIIKTTDL